MYVNGDVTKRGKICYIGELSFAKGEFAGIALDKPSGTYVDYLTIRRTLKIKSTFYF